MKGDFLCTQIALTLFFIKKFPKKMLGHDNLVPKSLTIPHFENLDCHIIRLSTRYPHLMSGFGYFFIIF